MNLNEFNISGSVMYDGGEVKPDNMVKHEVDLGENPDEVTEIFDSTAPEICLGQMRDINGEAE